MLDQISIIIPVTPEEKAQQKLLSDLAQLNSEIIVVNEGTRAKSLNIGAFKAQQKFLWFLHADSRISANNLIDLATALNHSDADKKLHYFNLQYEHSSTVLTALNAWGANIRSRLFALPYGDQGFFLSKSLFEDIGGYPENSSYGEDLLFVRLVKKANIKLNRLPSTIKTSARQYNEQGWFKLTLLRQWQLIKLIRREL